jgi:hypothetical protein
MDVYVHTSIRTHATRKAAAAYSELIFKQMHIVTNMHMYVHVVQSRVINELTAHGVVVEDLGGDVQVRILMISIVAIPFMAVVHVYIIA